MSQRVVWFRRTFGKDADVKPSAFVLPDDERQKLADLQQQIATLAVQQSTGDRTVAVMDTKWQHIDEAQRDLLYDVAQADF